MKIIPFDLHCAISAREGGCTDGKSILAWMVEKFRSKGLYGVDFSLMSMHFRGFQNAISIELMDGVKYSTSKKQRQALRAKLKEREWIKPNSRPSQNPNG